MENEEHPLRRRELYALVWEKAVQKVAADTRVSCVRHYAPVGQKEYSGVTT